MTQSLAPVPNAILHDSIFEPSQAKPTWSFAGAAWPVAGGFRSLVCFASKAPQTQCIVTPHLRRGVCRIARQDTGARTAQHYSTVVVHQPRIACALAEEPTQQIYLEWVANAGRWGDAGPCAYSVRPLPYLLRFRDTSARLAIRGGALVRGRGVRRLAPAEARGPFGAASASSSKASWAARATSWAAAAAAAAAVVPASIPAHEAASSGASMDPLRPPRMTRRATRQRPISAIAAEPRGRAVKDEHLLH